MKKMLVAVAAAFLAVTGTAAPAAAQHPGGNGRQAYAYGGNALSVPCMGHVYNEPLTAFDRVPAGGIAFSASGRYVAVVVDPFNGGDVDGTRLLLVDTVDCRTPRDIGEVDFGSKVSWSPSGREIAVTRGGDVLVLSTTSGAVLRNLTPDTPDTVEADPTWHPRGATIAYSAADGIRSRPATGGPSTLLARAARFADYSPDGSRIAYLSDVDQRITTADARTGAGVVTTPITTYGSFTWSPDGRYFLFVGAHDADCIVATTGGRIVQRHGADAPCNNPAWQPLR